MAKFVHDADYYRQHEAAMADRIMEMMEKDENYNSVKNAIYADLRKPEDQRTFSDLSFLINGKGTDDPQQWVERAIFDFDHTVAPIMQLPQNTPAPLKCLVVKKYRKGLQKYRKAHGEAPPTEWIGEYLVEELSKLPVKM